MNPAFKDYMQNSKDFVPDHYHVEDPEKLELLKELGFIITDRRGLKTKDDIKENDMEVWALDMIMSKEEVRFMVSFKKKRVNKYTIEKLAKMNSMSVEKAQELATGLAETGILEYDYEGKNGARQYFIPKFVVGSGEYMMMNHKLLMKHPEIATLFNFTSQCCGPIASVVPPGGAGLGMHVIPVEKAIPAESKSVSIEHLSHWLKKYDTYAIGICSCRRQQAMRGEGTGDTEGYFCIALGDMAKYMVETGKDAHYATYNEVMDLLKLSEEKGFVHQITNLDGKDKIVGICNCAPGVCNALRTSQLYNTPNMSASAYRAHVDPKKCVACGKCVEVCPVGAAKLGQKLCHKNGTQFTYPKSELPDLTKWSVAKWNYNYRDDAKINCYDTGTSPCKVACPAHLAVQGYIELAREGRYQDALRLIKLDNPFPMVCGDICNRRCESRCTRGTIDEPVAIDEIKKFIARQELDEKNQYIPDCSNAEGKEWNEKIAIIGAGPAGLSAAYYLRCNGYPVTAFEKEKEPGGMLRYGIPSFRLEKNVIDAEINIIRKMGVEIKCGVNVGKDVTLEELRKEGYKAFFVSIGLQEARKAGIPNEDAFGVEGGISFLRRINLDEKEKVEGNVVVVGGGNVAIDVARTALRAGASKVDVYCLESRDIMPASKDEILEAEHEGISFHPGWGPKEVKKDEKGHVSSIVFKKCVSVFDEEHHFSPKYDENELVEANANAVLMAIGQASSLGDIFKGSKARIRRNGTVEADPITLQTAEPDIFVGGDIYHGARFAIDAIAEGKEAAVSIHRYVQPGQSLTLGRDLRKFIELDRDDILVESYDNAKREVPGVDESKKLTFQDERKPFTEEQMKKEASRCLHCGATVVDTNRCIGCGLCTTRCEFDAIHLSRDLPKASRMYTGEDGIYKSLLPYMIKRKIKMKFVKKDSK